MKNRTMLFVLTLLIVATLILTACGRAQPTPVSHLSETFKQAYKTTADTYSKYADLDGIRTKYGRSYGNRYESMLSQVSDQLAVASICTDDTTQFTVALANATFGDRGLQGETEALLSMVSLQETFPGDIEKCQAALTDVIIYMQSQREMLLNDKAQYWFFTQQAIDLEEGDFNSSVVIKFYNKYGGDVNLWIESNDQEFAQFVQSQSEDKRLPPIFSGLPTMELQATTRNLVMCQAMADRYNGIALTPAGTYENQYFVSIDSATGICTLYAKAAEAYYSSIMTISAAAENNLQQGCTSAIPGNCPDPNKP